MPRKQMHPTRAKLSGIVRSVIHENNCSIIRMFSDKRKGSHPSNIYGNQLKYWVIGKTNRGTLTLHMNRRFKKAGLPFAAVTTHSINGWESKKGYRPNNYIQIMHE